MINVFIFGSCVSRDTIEASRSKFNIIDYYARSSFYSLGTKPASYDSSFIENITSAFQKKMVARDISKSIFSTELPENIDLVLMDFIDERCGLALASDNSVATLSREFSGIIDGNVDYKKIPNDDDLYYQGFEKGFLDFLNYVGNHKNRIKIIKTFWAKVDTQGKTLEKPSIQTIEKQNRKLEKLYSIASKYLNNYQFIEIAPESLVVDSEHKWGPAPFHYSKDFYDEAILSIIN